MFVNGEVVRLTVKSVNYITSTTDELFVQGTIISCDERSAIVLYLDPVHGNFVRKMLETKHLMKLK